MMKNEHKKLSIESTVDNEINTKQQSCYYEPLSQSSVINMTDKEVKEITERIDNFCDRQKASWQEAKFNHESCASFLCRIERTEQEDLEYDSLLSEDDKGANRRYSINVSSEEEVKRILDECTIPLGTRVVLSKPQLFFYWINLIVNKQSKLKQSKRYYFRGESSTEYQLIPSLLRKNHYENLKEQHNASSPLELQKKLLNRYRRYTQHLIHADHDFNAPINEAFDTLCLAQHYGLPTLLMDWTLNPFVAAFFACSKVTSTILSKKVRTTEDNFAVERILNIRDLLKRNIEKSITNKINFNDVSDDIIKEWKEINFDSDITKLFHQVLTQAPTPKYWIRIWVMRLKEANLRKDLTIHLEDRKEAQESEKLFEVEGMLPKGPRIVVPLVFTRRIASQFGRFIYCGCMEDTEGSVQSLTNFTDPNSRNLPWDRLYSLDVEFSIKNKSENPSKNPSNIVMKEVRKMMQQLEFMGFHAGQIFPDLEGWAEYLAGGSL